MNITELIENATVTATLARDGEGIAQPVTARGWIRGSGTISSIVTFGPYPERVTSDSVLIAVNGGEPEQLRLMADGGEFNLPAGFEFEYRLTIQVRTEHR